MISGKISEQARIKWQALITAQRSSGLDIVEYCKNKGIGRSNFYEWRKRLLNINKKSGFLKLMPSGDHEPFLSTASYETPINIKTPNGYLVGLRMPDGTGLVEILGILKSL